MKFPDIWWGQWWLEDWSWNGLATKFWNGWCVDESSGEIKKYEDVISNLSPHRHSSYLIYECAANFLPNIRQATLQDYWRAEEKNLVQSPVDGKLFTKLHLPLAWQNGTPTGKADWRGDALDEIISREILRSHSLWKEASEYLKADCRAQLQGAVFKQFHITKCAKPLQELGDRFLVSANFTNVVFTDKALFYISVFPFDVGFDKSVFSNEALFEDTRFARRASFQNAHFCDNAIFTNSEFLSGALYCGSTFGGKASFHSAAFVASADFSETIFMDSVDFGGETYGRETSTADKKIELRARNLGSSLQKLAALSGSANSDRRRVKQFSALNSIFIGPANFSDRDIFGSVFQNVSCFENAKFFDLAKFQGANLHSGINFRGACFAGSLKNDTALFIKGGIYRCSKALSDVLSTLSSRWIGELPPVSTNSGSGSPTIDDARIKWKKDFESWKEQFLDDRRRHGELEHEVNNYKSIYFRELEDCFRTLKKFNEERRDRLLEGKFHRLELLARRGRGNEIGQFERAFSRAYESFSNFGTSIARPLFWLVGVIWIFAAIYAAMASLPFDWPNIEDRIEALSFSLGRVLPFGAWVEPEPCSKIGRMLSAGAHDEFECNLSIEYELTVAFFVRALATLESLFAIVLFFLTGLALRRRFQID